jgi:translation initiation factor IF-3
MIKATKVRVVFPEGGSQIMSIDEALQKAQSYNLDLVEVAPQSNPPVCKIVDYGKFKYELEKKLKEERKHQKANIIKEIRIRPQTTQHDYQIKLNYIKDFIAHKYKVKVNIIFKGREVTHSELGMNMCEKLKKDLENIASLENKPQLENKVITLIFAPKSEKSGAKKDEQQT